MTNIKTPGMWPEVISPLLDYPSSAGILMLLHLREETYRGFAAIEEEKGFLKKTMSLSTSEGQEAARILTQRGLEELAEAVESNDHDHYLEELIDAINYFWALAIIDPKTPLNFLSETIIKNLLRQTDGPERIGAKEIGETVLAMNDLFEKLRHRAWMVNIQSPYFDGWQELGSFLSFNFAMIVSQFKDWKEFVRFYIAKDNVLQFRIKTKY